MTDELEPTLFRRWTMGELMAEPDDFTWLARGLLAAPTYGQVAGEMKTLKSHLAGFIAVGLAAGVPIFGRFTPPKAVPVLTYVGEGGRAPWTRRTRRIARAMGVDPADLDMVASFDTAPIGSLVFRESLQRDLADIKPGLVLLDPLYTFHGTATRASDLHQEGALLNQLSGPCMAADASLLVVNHMNQTGSGMSLKRITMAGSGEWADTWLLVAHRQDPDVAGGRFWLTLEVGSRQWGGRTWDLDLDVGRFDEDTGTHVGDITWDLRTASGVASTDRRTEATARSRLAILDALADQPWTHTKTALKVIVGGSREAFTQALDDLIADDIVRHNLVCRSEAGIEKKRPLWGLTTTRADNNRPGCDVEDS